MIAWPHSTRRINLDITESTNRDAENIWRSGDSGPVWITANSQTRGRGRSGRPWVSAPGNLFASYLFGFNGAAIEAPLLGYVAALAVVDTIEVLAPGKAVTLKWPNDCLLEDRKVAGILLESFGQGRDGGLGVAIGIGLNLAHAPEISTTRWPATSVSSLVGLAPEPGEALRLLAHHFDRWLVQFTTKGFSSIQSNWEARAAHLGQEISMDIGAQRISGVCEGLESDGRLRLATASGMQMISAGDVADVRTSGHVAGH